MRSAHHLPHHHSQVNFNLNDNNLTWHEGGQQGAAAKKSLIELEGKNW